MFIKIYMGPVEAVSRFPGLHHSMTKRIKEVLSRYFKEHNLPEEEIMVTFPGTIETGNQKPRVMIEIVDFTSGWSYERIHSLKELVARGVSANEFTKGARITCFITKPWSSEVDAKF